MSKWAIFCLFFCFLLITAVLCLGSQVLADVNDPIAPPPEKNVPAFLNISGEYQVKRGALRLGTDDVTSPFNYQLEVVGEGAKISNVIADENLKVSNAVDTLFVDAMNNKVCLGPCLDIAGAKFEISGGGMIVSSDSNTGIFAVSSDSEAVYGSGDTVGVQGLASGADNYGIWAESALGTAVEGINQSYNYSSVYGQSDTGHGIYGTNTNLASLWAGYFVGRLESNSDVSGAKFLPTQLQSSLIPFTSGQVSGSYTISDIDGVPIVKYYDGTYLWIVDDSKLHKVRASDGFKIFDVSVGANPTDVLFDGNYIWVTVAGGNEVKKIDPYSGIEKCSFSVTSPQSITFDSQYYWVTASDTRELVKVDSDCSQVGSVIDFSSTASSLGKIIYNGSYLWILGIQSATGDDLIFNVNPSDGEAVGYKHDDFNNLQDIFFDNYYYWLVSGEDSNTITRFYFDNSQSPPVVTYGTYSTGTGPSDIAFDGTYIWVANVAGQSLTRLLAADPFQATSFSLGFTPTGMVFDGTYLWISGSTGLTKIYSGSGYGSTDLSDTLALQNNNPLIQQDGRIDISGSGRIGVDVTAGGELTADNNVWGAVNSDGSDIIVSDEWEATGEFPSTGVPRSALSLIEGNDGALYAGTKYNGHVYRAAYDADDDTWTWTDKGKVLGDSALSNYNYWIWGMVQASDGYIYASYGEEYGGEDDDNRCETGRVSRTKDGGDTWEIVYKSPCHCTDNEAVCTLNSECVNNVCYEDAWHHYDILEASDGYLYVTRYNAKSLVRSDIRSDDGTTWTETSDAPASYSWLLDASDGYMYAISKHLNRVAKTNDGGNTWITLPDLPDGVWGLDSIIEVNDGNIYNIYIGTSPNGDVFKSDDGGVTWQSTGDLTGATSVNSLLEVDGILYAGTREEIEIVGESDIGRIFISYDFGNTWVNTGNLESIDEGNPYQAEGVDSLILASDGHIYAGADIEESGLGRVFRNKGLTGTHSCPEGHFVKDVQYFLNTNQVSRIECAPL